MRFHLNIITTLVSHPAVVGLARQLRQSMKATEKNVMAGIGLVTWDACLGRIVRLVTQLPADRTTLFGILDPWGVLFSETELIQMVTRTGLVTTDDEEQFFPGPSLLGLASEAASPIAPPPAPAPTDLEEDEPQLDNDSEPDEEPKTEEDRRELTADDQVAACAEAHDLGLGLLSEMLGLERKPRKRKVTRSRRRRILAAISDHGFETVRIAMRNLVLSGHHRGENDEKKMWLDPMYALGKSGDKVEHFFDLCPDPDDDAFEQALLADLGLAEDPFGDADSDGPDGDDAGGYDFSGLDRESESSEAA